MTTRYKVLCQPSFHPEVDVEVVLGPEWQFVRVRTRGHGERMALSVEQGVRFLESMEALKPDSIPDGTEEGMDGCTFTCSIRYEDGAKHVLRASNCALPNDAACGGLCAKAMRAWLCVPPSFCGALRARAPAALPRRWE